MQHTDRRHFLVRSTGLAAASLVPIHALPTDAAEPSTQHIGRTVIRSPEEQAFWEEVNRIAFEPGYTPQMVHPAYKSPV